MIVRDYPSGHRSPGILGLVCALTLALAACDSGTTRPQQSTTLPTPVSQPSAEPPRFPIDLFTDEVAVVGSDGSGRRTISTTGEVVQTVTWLPDGRLAFTTETDDVIDGQLKHRGHLYVEGAAGEGMQLFYEANNPLAASWSPKGDWTAIHRRAFRTYETPGLLLMNSDGARSFELGSLTDAGIWLRDGRYAFVSQARLMIVTPGSNPEPVVASAPPLGGTPVPNSDGSLVMVSTSDRRFVVINLSAATVSAVSNGEVTGPPRWSPDGRRVLYETGIGTGLTDPTLWVYDADDGASELLLSGVQFIGGYDWSPDGTQVAFTVHDGDGAGLYITDVDTGERALIAAASDMGNVAWSRSGGAIAVNRNGCWRGCSGGPIDVVLAVDGQTRNLPYSITSFTGWSANLPLAWGGSALVEADSGGTSRQLDAVPDSSYRIVSSAPDGRTVAFVRSVAPPFHTFEVNVQTGASRVIDNPPHPEAQRARMNPTAVSPDGQSVATQRDGDFYLRPTDGPERLLARLPRTPGCWTVDQPIWSPAGSYLAYTGCLPGVWIINAATGDWYQLVRAAWCFFQDVPATLNWSADDTLIITANPTLC